MKKTFFLFAMFISVASSAQVAVRNTAVDYAAKKITFTVSWTTTPKDNKIWLLADYRKIENNAETGNWSRALIAAATKTAGVGSASTVAGNTRGFWLNTSGSSGSATVLATLAIPDEVTKFNWCAYAFDSPPAAAINAAGGYVLHGTPPFTVNGTTLGDGVTTFGAGTCITSITDATNNPSGSVPPLPVITGNNSPSRCDAGTVNLTTSATGGITNAMTYTWNINSSDYTAITTSGGGVNLISPSVSSSANYTVIATNANGCISATANGTINIVNTPSVPYVTSAGDVCDGNRITFYGNGGNGQYEWTGDIYYTTGTTNYSSGTSPRAYYVYVRSYATNGVVTCPSAWSGAGGATVIARSGDGQNASPCGCAAGLSQCNGGTCRYTCQTYSDANCISLCSGAGYNMAWNGKNCDSNATTGKCVCANQVSYGNRYQCNAIAYTWYDGMPQSYVYHQSGSSAGGWDLCLPDAEPSCWRRLY